MKHYHILIVLLLLFFAGCKHDETLDWKTVNAVWLENNARRYADDPNFHVLPSGVQYLVINEGLPTESRPNKTGYVTIQYTGVLIDGHVFDSTDRNAVDFSGTDFVNQLVTIPFNHSQSSSLEVGSLIKGMQEGLLKMRVPGQAIFFIPQGLAYGKDGNSSPGYKNYIPPYSTLIFRVKLLSREL